jgi:long-chain acyl-CoA synthetase
MQNLEHVLMRFRSYGQEPCILDRTTQYNYVQLLDEAERWKGRLDAMNVGPGDVIGLRADYSLHAVAALLALAQRRSVVALIPREVDPANYFADARAQGTVDLNPDGTYEWQSLPPPNSHPLLDQLRRSGDGGIILFTSGSTGHPKAALHSMERFLHKFRKPGRRFRTLAFLIFDHIAGLDTLFYTLSNGGTLVLTRRRDPRTILEVIESHKVEVLPTSPTFLRLLCTAGNPDGRDVSSLKVITYGSEPMDPSTLARLNSRFPDVQISQKYGTTETGAPRTVSRGNDSLWLSIRGDGMDTKVIDGVLWIRGEGTILGYLNATSPIDEQGWYCTGDLVDVDGEWIRFRGRAVELINVGGEKVAPAEVEQRIRELDFVHDVLVSGAPHPLMGHVITARVALANGAVSSAEATKRIREHCLRNLARFKVPVTIEITSELSVTGRQKTQRR